MKPEQQVCTLEQGRRLKELGITGCSLFYWVDLTAYGKKMAPNGYEIMPHDEATHESKGCCFTDFDTTFNAFIVSELGQMCNSETCTMRTGTEMSEYANWEWQHQGNDQALGLFNTEAEARAALLIHLLETNHLTAEEANKRLMQ